MDFLAENGNLELQFIDDNEEFDEELMAKLAEESLAREESYAREQELELAAAAAAAEEGESTPAAEVVGTEASASEEDVAPEPVAESVEEEAPEEPEASENVAPEERDYANMTLEEKAYYSLLDSGALDSN
jgi:hypothetical protein